MVYIEGVVEELIYSNEANGYTVCCIKRGEEVITAVGYMPFINVGETLELSGEWVTHPDYGEQFRVEEYRKIMPRTESAILKYLSSGIVKGVGPVTAARIVERFGEKTLEVIESCPEKLSEIKGIGLEKALKIGQAFQEQRELHQVVMFLQGYGISPIYAAKIYRTFGERTIEAIKENPYRLADQALGIGFKKADAIARSLGIEPTSRFRVYSGIKYVLSQAAASGGHTYLPEEQLKDYTCQLLNVSLESIDDALMSLAVDRVVVVEKRQEETRVYLLPYYYAETNVCRRLAELAATPFKGELKDIEDRLKEIQKEEGIVLSAGQKRAVEEALKNGVIVITGGPGTGKTTIIKSIIRLLEKEGYTAALAAPTGRAAKNMSEATGYEAKTIHRLLEIGYMGDDETELFFARNENNPLEADVVIIDEMSMVDVLLMNHLLKAIVPGTRLVLVGDVDQLPSVGAGNVLKDIIMSGVIKTVKLTEIFRQAQMSMITVNAHRINRGEAPILNLSHKDFFFIRHASPTAALKTIGELCSGRLPAKYGYNPVKHIQVLTPTKKGVTGVASLNIELQKLLNPRDGRKMEKAYGDFVFREGDRVMQIRNNYELRWKRVSSGKGEGLGVFNGDTGTIRRIDHQEQKIEVLFEDERLVEYDFSILDEIEPAYAITVHKSQGSEFPVVIMPVFPGPEVLMTRNLLYTAVTRARELVILVGSEKALHRMVANLRETMRFSGMAEKLRSLSFNEGEFSWGGGHV